jgi:hypothetical protein
LTAGLGLAGFVVGVTGVADGDEDGGAAAGMI